MKDQDTRQKFIELRAAGRTFDSIAGELNVSKPTLVAWSRKYQFDIANLKAIETEALAERFLASREQRAQTLAGQLQAIEAELAKRDLADLSTQRLFALATSLRRQLRDEFGTPQFVTTVRDIPREEYTEEIQQWTP